MYSNIAVLGLFFFNLFFICCSTSAKTKGISKTQSTLILKSSAFVADGKIPPKYTCEGEDISPQLTWSEVPEKTKSIALIVDDPDAPDPKAPKMRWVHWVLYNIPSNTIELPENIKKLPTGTKEGLNDWKITGYRGPCPPIGEHRYFHQLYFLDIVIPDLGQIAKPELVDAMQGHILKKVTLIGKYQKKG